MTSVLTETGRQSAVLEDILRQTRSARGRRPVLIFDIDDTLLSTTGRNLRILREYAAQTCVRRHYPLASRRLAAVRASQVRYSIADTAREAGVEDAALLEALRSHWWARFFKNEYLLEDRPVPGAPEYCRKTVANGATVVYLTGRDESMRSGTESGLAVHGFPMPGKDPATLVLKPAFETPDHEFKKSSLERIASLGKVLAGFENEPAHVNLLQETFPSGTMVLVETRHSGKPVEPLAQVRRIKDYVLDNHG